MATEKTTKTKAKTTSKSTSRTAASASKSTTVKIRMYRQGLGDCFLVTLPRDKGEPFYIMIDCGVIIGTQDATAKMQAVVKDIIKTTNGHIDLLLATHEHWDHLSGFVQAKELFSQLNIDKVWMSWAENPEDELAQKIRAERQALRMALTSASARMRLDGGGDSLLDSLLEFFGATGHGTTAEALEVVRHLGEPRYCHPSDKPEELTGTGVRAYILGPPPDEALLKRSNPSSRRPETYSLAAVFLNQLTPELTDDNRAAPFDSIWQIPTEMAQQMPFFQQHYWGVDADLPEASDQAWRRIDSDWLDISSSLALQLDSATNNTSLVLALELANRDVLLFAADAQVGNWLSWQDLSWAVNGETVTGTDLLKRTVFYKTGHHGSHNATLREQGLELMTNLKVACVPVDHEMAVKKNWGQMPLGELESRLNAITKGGVLRSDQGIPLALKNSVQQDTAQALYYEVELGG